MACRPRRPPSGVAEGVHRSEWTDHELATARQAQADPAARPRAAARAVSTRDLLVNVARVILLAILRARSGRRLVEQPVARLADGLVRGLRLAAVVVLMLALALNATFCPTASSPRLGCSCRVGDRRGGDRRRRWSVRSARSVAVDAARGGAVRAHGLVSPGLFRRPGRRARRRRGPATASASAAGSVAAAGRGGDRRPTPARGRRRVRRGRRRPARRARRPTGSNGRAGGAGGRRQDRGRARLRGHRRPLRLSCRRAAGHAARPHPGRHRERRLRRHGRLGRGPGRGRRRLGRCAARALPTTWSSPCSGPSRPC